MREATKQLASQAFQGAIDPLVQREPRCQKTKKQKQRMYEWPVWGIELVNSGRPMDIRTCWVPCVTVVDIVADRSLVRCRVLVEDAQEVFCIGAPENIKGMLADTDVLIVPVSSTLPLAVADTEVMLPIGVSSADEGTGALICLIVLKYSGAHAPKVKLEGLVQSRLSGVETQQFHLATGNVVDHVSTVFRG